MLVLNKTESPSRFRIEGCVVLKEDEQALRKAWKEYHEKKKVAAEKVSLHKNTKMAKKKISKLHI